MIFQGDCFYNINEEFRLLKFKSNWKKSDLIWNDDFILNNKKKTTYWYKGYVDIIYTPSNSAQVLSFSSVFANTNFRGYDPLIHKR